MTVLTKLGIGMMSGLLILLTMVVMHHGIALAASHSGGGHRCINGYVWREAFPGDYVCVTPQQRSQVAYDNSQAPYRVDPSGGPYGPDTCLNGYVWRQIISTDHVCVTPQERSQVAYDNSQAPSRYQGTGVPIDPGTALNPASN